MRPPLSRYDDRTMLPTPDEAAELGRAVVADGRLKEFRERLGITRNAMSELLYVNMRSYTDWETRPDVKLRQATAQRIGRFYFTAHQELELLDEWGLNTEELVPFNVMATLLGVPNEVLLQWYREERFEAVDAGILGLWVHRSDITRMRYQR